MIRKNTIIPVLAILLLFPFAGLYAQGIDTDGDGVPDKDEIGIYGTDPENPDTDGDGFSDFIELNKNFSPHSTSPDASLDKNDQDTDGLSDREELRFGTSLLNADTDGDGYADYDEVRTGFDPLSKSKVKIKAIKIDTKRQILAYYFGKIKLGEYKVSTGKASMPTPKGNFKISNKIAKAWSKPYGLWMPYWLGIGDGKFGIHELPVWPNGYREGENHLGIPVSHGCIRLGVGPAKKLYDWAEPGTPVNIY